MKEKIRTLVAAEKQGDPLSDQAIADILRTDQIDIARRTVAKYRQRWGSCLRAAASGWLMPMARIRM